MQVIYGSGSSGAHLHKSSEPLLTRLDARQMRLMKPKVVAAKLLNFCQPNLEPSAEIVLAATLLVYLSRDEGFTRGSAASSDTSGVRASSASGESPRPLGCR